MQRQMQGTGGSRRPQGGGASAPPSSGGGRRPACARAGYRRCLGGDEGGPQSIVGCLEGNACAASCASPAVLRSSSPCAAVHQRFTLPAIPPLGLDAAMAASTMVLRCSPPRCPPPAMALRCLPPARAPRAALPCMPRGTLRRRSPPLFIPSAPVSGTGVAKILGASRGLRIAGKQQRPGPCPCPLHSLQRLQPPIASLLSANAARPLQPTNTVKAAAAAAPGRGQKASSCFCAPLQPLRLLLQWWWLLLLSRLLSWRTRRRAVRLSNSFIWSSHRHLRWKTCRWMRASAS